MPCWQVQTVSVEFHAKHGELLEKAIKALGWSSTKLERGYLVDCGGWSSIEINLVTGKANIDSNQQNKLNLLKQEYSKQAINMVAKLSGWQNRKLTGLKGQLLRSYL